MKSPEIYIHVGMGRAGSTFLQYQVFPKIKGVKYIQRTRFRKAKKIISKGKHMKYLVSGELDNRLIENYLNDFASSHNYARPILVIRHHDEWIASQYRRYLKNGNHLRFNEFFDVENDEGYWKLEQLYYFPIIKLLEKYFKPSPLILFYDDLRSDPVGFIRKIVAFISGDINMNRINLDRRHVSYSKKQLGAIYLASGRFNLKKKRPFNKKWQNVLFNLGTNMLRYAILYTAMILPAGWFRVNGIFPTDEQLEAIRKLYKDDWEQCRAFIQKISSEE